MIKGKVPPLMNLMLKCGPHISGPSHKPSLVVLLGLDWLFVLIFLENLEFLHCKTCFLYFITRIPRRLGQALAKPKMWAITSPLRCPKLNLPLMNGNVEWVQTLFHVQLSMWYLKIFIIHQQCTFPHTKATSSSSWHNIRMHRCHSRVLFISFFLNKDGHYWLTSNLYLTDFLHLKILPAQSMEENHSTLWKVKPERNRSLMGCELGGAHSMWMTWMWFDITLDWLIISIE